MSEPVADSDTVLVIDGVGVLVPLGVPVGVVVCETLGVPVCVGVGDALAGGGLHEDEPAPEV